MSKPASLKLTAAVEHWPLKAPFHITAYTFVTADVVVVTVERNGLTGRGEASGVYYLSDDAPHMLTQIEKVRDLVEGGGRSANIANFVAARWCSQCDRLRAVGIGSKKRRQARLETRGARCA